MLKGKKNTISAAIDFSTNELTLAVRRKSDTAVFATPMPPRDSARIVSWTYKSLKTLDLEVRDISRWTCGTGPGSFTALRCVAALTAGFATASERMTRGVPSALALAAEIAEKLPETARIALLYDGRRGEALTLSIARSGTELKIPEPCEITTISGDAAASTLLEADALVAPAKERNGLAKALPKGILKRITYIERFPVERLLDVEEARWNRETLLNPIYLRAATHIAPKQPRQVD